MIWNAWGILYAVFGALITAIHFNHVSDVLGNGFLGFLRGVPDSVILTCEHCLCAGHRPGPFYREASDFRRHGIDRVRIRACGRDGSGRCPGRRERIRSRSERWGCRVWERGGAGRGIVIIIGLGAIASSTPPPAPTMPEFLRSGIASAMNGNASPPAPRVSSNGGRQMAVAAGAGGPAISYRPRGVVEVISFNAGKALGKAAGSKREGDGNE